MEQAIVDLQKKFVRAGFVDWHCITETMVVDGDITFIGTLLRFVLDRYPEVTKRQLERFDWFVVEQDDVKLALMVHRLLREGYAYKSSLLPTQFSRNGLGLKKVQFLLHVLSFFKEDARTKAVNQHNSRLSVVSAASTQARQCVHLETINAKQEAVVQKLHMLERRRRELNRTMRQPVVDPPLFIE